MKTIVSYAAATLMLLCLLVLFGLSSLAGRLFTGADASE